MKRFYLIALLTILLEIPDIICQGFQQNSGSQDQMGIGINSPTIDYRLLNWMLQKGNGTQWIDYFLCENFYDIKGNLIRADYKMWDTTSAIWVNNHTDTYNYDINSRLIEFFQSVWTGEEFKNHAKQTYTYTTFDSLSELKVFLWDDSLQDWQNYNRTIYDYDINQFLVEKVYYEGNGTNWELYSKSIYTYDSFYKVIEKLYRVWTGVWENFNRTLYSYDNNRISYFLWQHWINNAWVIDHKESFTYDNNSNMIERLVQTGGGLNLFKDVLSYNTQNYLITVLNYSWINDIWVDNTWKNNFYDSYENLIESITKYRENNLWVNQWRTLNNYFLFTDIENVSNSSNYDLSNAYPNPFNPITTINYSVAKQSNVTIIIYDVLSRQVTTLVNEEKPAGYYEVEFNASSLASGIYFYRIQAENFVDTKKMILLK